MKTNLSLADIARMLQQLNAAGLDFSQLETLPIRDLLINEEELLDILMVTPRTLLRYRKKGTLRAVCFGGRRFYLRHLLIEDLLRHLSPPGNNST